MALEGIAQQQNAFNMGLGSIMANRKNQEAEMRRLAITNFTQMMLQQYQRKHDEELAARKRKQAMGMQIASIATLGLAGPVMGAFSGGALDKAAGEVYDPGMYSETFMPPGMIGGNMQGALLTNTPGMFRGTRIPNLGF